MILIGWIIALWSDGTDKFVGGIFEPFFTTSILFVLFHFTLYRWKFPEYEFPINFCLDHVTVKRFFQFFKNKFRDLRHLQKPWKHVKNSWKFNKIKKKIAITPTVKLIRIFQGRTIISRARTSAIL